MFALTDALKMRESLQKNGRRTRTQPIKICLRAKDVFKGGDDWIWNQMQGVVSLWKPAYYENEKRCQSGLESDSDSLTVKRKSSGQIENRIVCL